jgi:hypothetical protein
MDDLVEQVSAAISRINNTSETILALEIGQVKKMAAPLMGEAGVSGSTFDIGYKRAPSCRAAAACVAAMVFGCTAYRVGNEFLFVGNEFSAKFSGLVFNVLALQCEKALGGHKADLNNYVGVEIQGYRAAKFAAVFVDGWVRGVYKGVIDFAQTIPRETRAEHYKFAREYGAKVGESVDLLLADSFFNCGSVWR